MEEFILRDGEVAIIEHGETRAIMNVNTLLELRRKLRDEEAKEKLALIAGVSKLAKAVAEAKEEEPTNTKKNDSTCKSFSYSTMVMVRDHSNASGYRNVSLYYFSTCHGCYSPNCLDIIADYPLILDSTGRLFESQAVAASYWNISPNSVNSQVCNRSRTSRVYSDDADDYNKVAFGVVSVKQLLLKKNAYLDEQTDKLLCRCC